MPPPRLPTTPERSAQMGRIRGRDTRPEVRLCNALAGVGAYAVTGFSIRLEPKQRPCRPDLAFPDQALLIFVDGCQWHGCPEHYVRPRTNSAHWANRLASAVERDRRQTAALREAGWRVLRYWGHRIDESLPEVVLEIVAALEGAPADTEQRWCVLAVQLVEGTERLEERRLIELLDPGRERLEQKERSTRKWKRRPVEDPA